MERQNFIRNTEDFICEHCAQKVQGTGYTNHCPRCLYSKHVDNLPGDRANQCCGLMEPIGLEVSGSGQDIVHRCLRCGVEKKNKRSELDDPEAVISLLNL